MKLSTAEGRDEVGNQGHLLDQGCHGPVMDRAIEPVGLPHSFSANIAHKGGTPETKTSNVKSIINWIETTSRAGSVSPTQSPVPHLAKLNSSSSSVLTPRSAPTSGAKQDDFTTPTCASTAYGEEYSLTLLKHKQYFNNRPLARCLDPAEGGAQARKVGGTFLKSNTLSSTDDERAGDVTEKVEKEEGSQRRQGHDTKDQTTPPQAEEKNKASLQKREDAYGPVRRDPEDIAAFWGGIKYYLWISEEELDDAPTYMPCPLRSTEKSRTRQHGESISTVGNKTVEEKLSEADDFLGIKPSPERDNGQEQEVAAVHGRARLSWGARSSPTTSGTRRLAGDSGSPGLTTSPAKTILHTAGGEDVTRTPGRPGHDARGRRCTFPSPVRDVMSEIEQQMREWEIEHPTENHKP